MNYEITSGSYDAPGVLYQGGVTAFTIENSQKKECRLLLIPKDGGEPVRIPMEAGKCAPGLYSVGVKLPRAHFNYAFEIDGAYCLDPYAKRIAGREVWGDMARDENRAACGFLEEERFSWGDDSLPGIPKEDMVIYKLHVRGFSMRQKLRPEERGTFRGIEKKLSYLKDLGITTLELMPVYEFEEMFAKDPYQRENFPADKINYWGYTGGNYFALKSAYLGQGGTEKRFKQLVQKLHRNEMECILEFYFDESISPCYALEALRYWAREYHVDGFHVIGSAVLAELIAADPCLSGRKLFFDWFSEEISRPKRHTMELYSYNDGFLYGVRKIMNYQGANLDEFADYMRRQQKHQGFINYLATNNGFTLYDLFSYTERQNQANGEENRDGLSVNFSVNCGQEGQTKKKSVLRLRDRQVKNALCTLFFAQGVPLLWMGDECLNSQMGNNNAYCQDNELGWKSWEQTKRSRELIEFVRGLSRLRRDFPMLRRREPVEFKDVLGTGYPDLSYHGANGWRMEAEHGGKCMGMMYSDRGKEKQRDEYLYIGYNFSQTNQALALPDLPKGYGWCCMLDTGEEEAFAVKPMEEERTFAIQGQSVCLLVGLPGAKLCGS